MGRGSSQSPQTSHVAARGTVVERVHSGRCAMAESRASAKCENAQDPTHGTAVLNEGRGGGSHQASGAVMQNSGLAAPLDRPRVGHPPASWGRRRMDSMDVAGSGRVAVRAGTTKQVTELVTPRSCAPAAPRAHRIVPCRLVAAGAPEGVGAGHRRDQLAAIGGAGGHGGRGNIHCCVSKQVDGGRRRGLPSPAVRLDGGWQRPFRSRLAARETDVLALLRASRRTRIRRIRPGRCQFISH